MIFECEGKAEIQGVTATQIRKTIKALRSFGPSSYASLTDEKSGDYIQVAGGGVTCMLELYRANSKERLRAFHEVPNNVFPDGTLLVFGAGSIPMKSDEWFTAEKVTEVFCLFLGRAEIPSGVYWRPVYGI